MFFEYLKNRKNAVLQANFLEISVMKKPFRIEMAFLLFLP